MIDSFAQFFSGLNQQYPFVLFEFFSFSFIVRALFVGILVALCASLLGVSLVLKRYSMIGDGLSHVGFGTLALAAAINMALSSVKISPLWVSIPLVLIAAFLLLRLSENGKIKGDAAIALVSASSLAIGVIILSQTTGMNTDVCNYMFGTILAISDSDLYLSIAVTVIVLILYVVFYNRIFAVTFDENYARATGTRAGLYNMLLALLTALTIVVGMRIMGAMLISSLIIFPALTSMRVFKSFRGVVVCSAVLSVVCFFSGIVASYMYNIPAGASVVMINLAAFILFALAGLVKKQVGGKAG